MLSPRQTEVAKLVAQGLSNKEIAKTLFIGNRTVETHVSTILGRMQCRNRAELAVVIDRLERAQ